MRASTYVRVARDKLGLKQDEFAKLLGLARETISRYEHAAMPVPKRSLMAIENLLRDHQRKRET